MLYINSYFGKCLSFSLIHFSGVVLFGRRKCVYAKQKQQEHFHSEFVPVLAVGNGALPLPPGCPGFPAMPVAVDQKTNIKSNLLNFV